MKDRKNNTNKFVKIIALPKRALAKAIDLYVKSMNTYADHACFASGFGVSGLGFAVAEPLPCNFSANLLRSSTEFDDLIKASSSRAAKKVVDLEDTRPDFLKPTPPTVHRRHARVPRGGRVAMPRIDEDKACDFEDDDCVQEIQRQRACFAV